MRIILMLLVLSLSACVNTPEGDRKVGADECVQTAALVATASPMACEMIVKETEEETERIRRICRAGVTLSEALAVMGCVSFGHEAELSEADVEF